MYTKDIRESTTNVIGTDGTAAVSYSYDTFGETTEYQQDENNPFYNEICYTAGVYDKTTGLYNLSARYYDPTDGIFLSQDTYRGSRSRTATLNYYAYCAGNPVSYTDPSGHAFWAVAGAAMGAYDGYKYAQKNGWKGGKKVAAAVVGGLASVVNPIKVFSKGVKVVKFVSKTKVAKKVVKAVKKAVSKPKPTKVDSKNAKSAVKNNSPPKSEKAKSLPQNIHIASPDLSKLDPKKAKDVVNSFKDGKYVNETYGEGTTLYRVGDKRGDYWSLDPPPPSKKQ